MNAHFAVILVAALPAAALAQQEVGGDKTAAESKKGRTAPEVNGHIFPPSFLVDTPFRETTFKLGILYGFGKATGAKYDLSGNPIPNETVDYNFASFAQTFRFEYQFWDWFSAGVAIVTNLYSGIDGPSAVSIGAQVGVGAGLRLRAGHRFGPVETAIVLDVSNAPEYGILVVAALVKAIQDRQIEPGTALQAKHTRTVNPLISAAWAASPAFGVTANVGYVYKELRLSDNTTVSHQNGITAGAIADFDFGKVSEVPVDVYGGYRLTAPLGDNGVTRIDDIALGFGYTAVRELALSLELGWRDFQIRPPLDSQGWLAQFALQYYW